MGVLNIIEKLRFYMSYPFVVYALVVGVFIALCSSLFGVSLVLKRFSFIGDGLSHVAFGAMSVSAVLNLANDTLLTMPITILVAIILLKLGENAKIKGDALIAILSVGSLAIGYMLVNMFSSSANVSGDVCTSLFGSTSILTLTKTEVIVCITMSLVVISLYIVFYNKIFAITFDETFAKATGVNTERYNLFIAIIIAIIIVLGMNLVGSLLISALIVFPALSAMRLMKTFRAVVICSAVMSIICALLGILSSILLSTPVGSTIVLVNIILFILSSIIGKVIR
jgi:hypothetical protein